MSREAAQEELANNDYSNKLQEQDKEFVIKKLEISSEEFERIMHQPPKSFWNYPSYKKIFYRHHWIIRIYHALRRV